MPVWLLSEWKPSKGVKGSRYHVDATNVRQTPGVTMVLSGTYLLEVEEARMGLLAPLHLLLRRPGTFLVPIHPLCYNLKSKGIC